MKPTAARRPALDYCRRFVATSPDAWRRFVAIYAPLVYGWCRRDGVQAGDAGDVVQDVFTKVFTAIGGFRHDQPSGTLRGWLRVICRNCLYDRFRRDRGLPPAAGGTDAQLLLANLAEVEDESTVYTERRGVVHRALELVRGEFETKTWQAFWLVAVEEISTAEAAERLGMKSGAVRQAKYMVLRRLRDELGADAI